MERVRSAGLRGFRSVVASLGGDADDLARRAELPEGALDSDDVFVPQVNLAIVLELAAQELGCPDFGVRVAARQHPSLMGPLWVAIQHSATLGEALDCGTDYLFAHAPALRLHSFPDPYGTRGVIGVGVDAGPGRELSVQGAGLLLGFLHRAIVALAGPDYGLRGVEVPHELDDRGAYEDYFRAPVRVNRPAAMLRGPASLLRRPIDTGNADVRHLALSLIAHTGRPSRQAGGTAAVVRGELEEAMGGVVPGLPTVARRLGVHPRTLQRRLEAEATTFEAVLDDARRVTVRRLLSTTTLSIAEVAREVGYREQATLTRRARTWWGMTPSQVRREGLSQNDK